MISQKNNNDYNKPIIYHAKQQKIILRKKHLFNELSENKLEYKKNGICDAYIKYGKHNINDVIDIMKNKNLKEEQRLRILLKKLKKENELYDENISYYRDYIKNGGNINYTVSNGIKEWFYINKTNYIELLEQYRNEDIAKSYALNTYLKKEGRDRYTKRIQDTEMTIRIY
tara:strand:+ start:59 stop:571 length:513 start_codon:yes stop_codon:yes gene_type:complete